MQRIYCRSVADYVDAIGPHDQHATYRCDDVEARLLGRGCRDHGVEALVGIAAFKATGDLPEYERLMKEKFPPPDKKAKKPAA
jgi:hypothetical protein